jgi:hypothetical protein
MASEAGAPGSFPSVPLRCYPFWKKKTGTFSRRSVASSFATNSEALPAILHVKRLTSIHSQEGINSDTLRHLNTVGLLQYSFPFLTDNVRFSDAPTVEVEYFGDRRAVRISKTHPENGKYYINYGSVMDSYGSSEQRGKTANRPRPGGLR